MLRRRNFPVAPLQKNLSRIRKILFDFVKLADMI